VAGSGRGLTDRLLTFACTVLMAVVALYVAALLLRAIWPVLAMAGIVLGTVFAAVAVGRFLVNRRRYW
jgi:hypothetical protein